MLSMNRRMMVKSMLAGLVLCAGALTATAAPPPVSINLCNREAHAWPNRRGFTHTGGGNIHVLQPTPDMVIITLTGVAVAGPHPIQNSLAQMAFEVCQDLEISFDDPRVKRAKLSIEGRVTGLLRSEKTGLAAISQATAVVSGGGGELLSIAAPTHTVNKGVNLSINDQIACQSIPVLAGPLKVTQTLCISASTPRTILPRKASSSEFAPDPALDPLWISYWEPFHGAEKKDFGFQIILRVSDDSAAAAVPVPVIPAKPVIPVKPVVTGTPTSRVKVSPK